MKTMIFTYGRFNPPTLGHEKIVNFMMKIATVCYADHGIFPSQSKDNKKNPLKFSDKLKFLRKSFPDTQVINNDNCKTLFTTLETLSNAGYKKVIMIVGSDRVREFRERVYPYINHPDLSCDFDEFHVINGGNRESNDEISKISATKMRECVKRGDLTEFSRYVPSKLKETEIIELFNLVQEGMV